MLFQILDRFLFILLFILFMIHMGRFTGFICMLLSYVFVKELGGALHEMEPLIILEGMFLPFHADHRKVPFRLRLAADRACRIARCGRNLGEQAAASSAFPDPAGPIGAGRLARLAIVQLAWSGSR